MVRIKFSNDSIELLANGFRYTWCSEKLINESYQKSQYVTLDDLIPMESKKGEKTFENSSERILIAHNAGFDRSFVKEQYFLEVNINF